MTDANMISWMEMVGAQVWRDQNHHWVCQVIYNRVVIQPTRPTIREAITAANDEYAQVRKEIEQ